MASHDDKTTIGHVGAIDNSSSSGSNHVGHPSNTDEEIIMRLETTGEEIGMTSRTILAATVSSLLATEILILNFVTEYGVML
jgi:hypothetical protein